MKYRITPLGRIVIISFCLTLIFIIFIAAINRDNKGNNNYSTNDGDLPNLQQSGENSDSLKNDSSDEDVSNNNKDIDNDAENTKTADNTIVEVTNSKPLINNMTLSIYFGANVSILDEYNYPALDLFAKAALSLDGLPIQIEGNCSTTSANSSDLDNENLNYELSLARAKAVSDYLQSKGIDPNRILIIGNGSLNPVKDNNTSDNRKLNRRVDIFFRNIED